MKWMIDNQNKIRKDKLTSLFICLELILYLTFLVLDLLQTAHTLSNILKYIAIWLCLIFAGLSYRKIKNKKMVFMHVILLFTVIADTFLLFSKHFEVGVLSFIIVQILYSRKIKAICKDGCKLYMVEILSITFIWNILILVLKNEMDLTPVIALAGLYFLLFTGNLIRIWCQAFKFRNIEDERVKQQIIIVTIGLTLFYFCDINVGLNFMQNGGDFSLGFMNKLASAAGTLIWFFYLPSQVILTLQAMIYDL